MILSVDEAHRLTHSLPAAVAQRDAEVVVVDDACTDTTSEVCARFGVRVVALEERLSYAAAMNRGLAEARGDAVLLLNADCVLDEGFLAAARPRLEEAGVGSVAPRLLRAVGLEEADRLDVLDAAGMTIDPRGRNALVGHGAPAGTFARGPAFGGDGACVLYRREVLDALGPEVLDEDLALWASDADLAWRAQALGWGCVYEPDALAWHVRFYSPTTRAALPAEHRRLQFRNRLLMKAKNAELRDVPQMAAFEVAALGYVLARERELLPAYREAWSLLPSARRRRRALRRTHRPPFGLRPPRP